MKKIAHVFRLIRMRQWHKNSFVLLGFFVLGDYGNYALLFKAILAFFAFCLASSGVYILNDYKDIEADRNHSLKKNRPLASGDIAVTPALFLSAILCLVSLLIAYYINVLALLIIFLYLLNNITYSLVLKRYPIIDVFQLGLGFMLRIFAGTLGIGIYISEWMILTGFMISLFIGFSKRYAELVNSDGAQNQRMVLKEYSIDILKSFMIIMASATIITYSLYTLSPRSIALHGTTNLIYTTPFVVYGIFRFLYLVLFHKSGEDPSSLIFEDKQLIFTLICWAVTYGLIIY
jgi:4-hydroxybenzoate polyprenyltransferase